MKAFFLASFDDHDVDGDKVYSEVFFRETDDHVIKESFVKATFEKSVDRIIFFFFFVKLDFDSSINSYE